ncbi:hypothetical protein LH464_04290 [Neorhizobium sp. T786]|uniref:hypothetical protein n=1 Tax=Pseudorhizobium xiangyangii TaxID=2883104 RepID=UPI001CFF8120|nr:hypothetical protein [Neorhizobium xiangyangii]MCB5201697.1 hypothetical protein [Neorhizobium xiangyangii]
MMTEEERKARHRERQKRYLAKPESKAKVAKWKEENADRVRLHNSTYYRKNRERMLAASQVWKEAHPEKVKEHQDRATAKRRKTGEAMPTGFAE